MSRHGDTWFWVGAVAFFVIAVSSCVIRANMGASAWNRLHPDAKVKATWVDALFLDLRAD